MKTYLCLLLLLAGLVILNANEEKAAQVPPNPMISFRDFQHNVAEAEKVRERRRLNEEQFLQQMKKPGVVLLDARSTEKFKLRHIAGAVNLSLPDFNEAALAKIIPAKDTPVLIYCNNNFENSPVAFTGKTFSAALNLHTFTSLIGYGYTQVYELGPLLDVNTTRLPFAGSEVGSKSITPTKKD